MKLKNENTFFSSIKVTMTTVRKPKIIFEDESIVVQDINSKFAYGMYGDFKVILMKSNRYINATKLCQQDKVNTKRFRDWLKNDRSKLLIQQINSKINENDCILQINNEKNSCIKGTYVHPLLIPHIAMWCSSEFAVKVSIWLEEWKKFDSNNSNRYWSALSNIKHETNISEEKKHQLRLQQQIPKSQIEVKTPVGYIDLLTCHEIIEIKKANDWKCALGQIISYGSFYERHTKVIYLFGVDKKFNLNQVRDICKKFNVEVRTVKE